MTYNNFSSKEPLSHCMNRTTRAMAKYLQQTFAKAGFNDITTEQWVIIVNLMRVKGQFQQQLADNIYKDKASVTRMIGSLEKKGLIERIPDKKDRRQKRIFLTTKGKTLFDKLKPLAVEVQDQAICNIDTGDLEFCKEIVLKIYKNIL